MSDHVDSIVIGAGVVGLAIARALAVTGREVIILESESAIGTGVSSRNSEVIHAGLYYPPGSLKSLLCVRGKELLYRYLLEHGIEHRRCGKLIVATDATQLADLGQIGQNAKINGVDDLQLLTQAETLSLEPALSCTGALLSPSSGIVDSHGLMLSLLGEAEARSAALALRSRVAGGRTSKGGMVLEIEGVTQFELSASEVINAAGLSAQQVARHLGLAEHLIPRQLLAKGQYFSVSGTCPFRRLIYPVPEPGGLGVHLTLDLAGQAKFGPDVQWIEQIDFEVDASQANRFAERIRAYWPALDATRLQPAYAGVRPKLKDHSDFVIQDATVHGTAGLINLYGIESPGLTASLAIAEEVLARLH
jgi:L-2-hydroxyglutarate oxidase LhgO